MSSRPASELIDGKTLVWDPGESKICLRRPTLREQLKPRHVYDWVAVVSLVTSLATLALEVLR